MHVELPPLHFEKNNFFQGFKMIAGLITDSKCYM